MSALAALAPLKILMIGNSFSISVLSYGPQVAHRLDTGMDICSLYIGGCSLARHAGNIRQAGVDPDFAPYAVRWSYDSLETGAEPPFAGVLKPDGKGVPHRMANVPQMLAADKWDVVTIQQASHESWNPATYEPFAGEVIATVRKYAPQAKIVIQQTWSYCDADGRIRDSASGGPGSWGFDQAGMFERLAENYGALARKYGFEIIPTGRAVQLYRESLPVRDIADDVVGNVRSENGAWKGDTIHLNKDGEYLQACVWVAKLLGADVAKLDWAPESAMRHPENAALIRRCAAAAVAELAPGGK